MDTSKKVDQIFDMGQFEKDTELSLRERVKELSCLYGITQFIMQNHDSFKEIFQGIVEFIPPAWQYPDITVGRISIDGQTYSSSNHKEFFHKQTSKIIVNEKERGEVEVLYIKKKADIDEGPFLKEERNLIDAIAKHVALVLERKEAEEERVRLQEQVMHADRLATIGQLAAGVAHELNEPLGNILGFAQLAQKGQQLSEQVRKDIDKIINSSLYAREIIKKLLLFARQTPTKKAKVNINTVVTEVLVFFKGRLAKEGVELETSLMKDMPEITVDLGQLNQVFVNLIVNAVQAMPKGGKLGVKTSAKKDSVCFSITDTGTGMSKQVQEKIFLPFYTTKDVQEGTGLGLSVVHGIIKAHNGKINVESRENQGSCFTVSLPLYTGEMDEG